MKKLSNIEYIILDLLRANGEMYGLKMVKASSKLKRGTIYVTLDRMTDKGLVVSRQEEESSPTGSKRRIYQISGVGRATLLAQEAFKAVFDANVQGAV